MSNSLTKIVLFEWEYLRIGDQDFSQSHYDALAAWLDRQDCPFFELHHKKIRFLQWVGVIQVGALCIEVLPKADKSQFQGPNIEPNRKSNGQLSREDAICKWQKILPEMIRRVHKVQLKTTDRLHLQVKRQSLLDLYFESFLREASQLIHRGLVKKYRMESTNRKSLKGRLDVSANLQHNFIHKERFYTSAHVFDRKNIWNQILLDALRVTSRVCQNSRLRAKAKNLELHFPDWNSRQYVANDFTSLVYDAKTEDYRNAIQLARLILLQQNPNMTHGQENVIAFLFDMNVLWEGWIEYKLKRLFKHNPHIKVYGQKSQKFWENKHIRPDLVIEDSSEGQIKTTVLDTKWKIPHQNAPSDADLKQMFVYNLYWGCSSSWLLYPESDGGSARVGSYRELHSSIEASAGHCGSMFLKVEEPDFQELFGMKI